MFRVLFTTVFILISVFLFAQPKTGNYCGLVFREDGKAVVFNIEIHRNGKQTRIFIINATEKIQVTEIIVKSDSLFFNMPAFESVFRMEVKLDGSLKGEWIKGTAGKTQYWPFIAIPGKKRFDLIKGPSAINISGRWAVTITRANGTTRPAIAELLQRDNNITGTFLTPSGDYRYLQGIVTGDSLLLSTFDGAHAYLFTAKIIGTDTISEGFFGSGFAGKETWVAVKNEQARLPESQHPQLREGYTKLDFTFNDLEGNSVSIGDKRFQNKVVIVQLMGSWCPNCLDETRFLSDYYNKNRNRGLEIVSLAYEYSTDSNRSRNSLRKFQQLFQVNYPMLLTGIAAGDSLKTEKTLPQITPIRYFPTTIYLDRSGNVQKIRSSFFGPGSGKHYDEFKVEFNRTMDELLSREY